jgi:hypothetical protein
MLLHDRPERFLTFCCDCGEETPHDGFDEFGSDRMPRYATPDVADSEAKGLASRLGVNLLREHLRAVATLQESL